MKKNIIVLILLLFLIINVSSCSNSNYNTDVDYTITSARITVGTSKFDLSVKEYEFLENGTIMIIDDTDRVFIVDKSNVLLLNLKGKEN